MYKHTFPERIRKARKDTGYKQSEVSVILGISAGTISKYETGNLEPNLEKLALLAQFYAVSADWLIGIE